MATKSKKAGLSLATLSEIVVPSGGVFGDLDAQLRDNLESLAEKRMSIMNEIVAVENTANQLLENQVLPVARRRLEQVREYITTQGYTEQDED